MVVVFSFKQWYTSDLKQNALFSNFIYFVFQFMNL